MDLDFFWNFLEGTKTLSYKRRNMVNATLYLFFTKFILRSLSKNVRGLLFIFKLMRVIEKSFYIWIHLFSFYHFPCCCQNIYHVPKILVVIETGSKDHGILRKKKKAILVKICFCIVFSKARQTPGNIVDVNVMFVKTSYRILTSSKDNFGVTSCTELSAIIKFYVGTGMTPIDTYKFV